MSLKIYGIPDSRARRTLWVAEELDLDYELITTQPHKDDGSRQNPAFIAANPNRRVPTIEDAGFALWESLAINLYLAKKNASELYPTDLQDEALCWQWSMWALTELDKQIITWALHDQALPIEQRDPNQRDASRAEMERPLTALESMLEKKRYLVWDRFSIADLNVASTMYRSLWMNLEDKPAVAAWLKECWARPAAVRVREKLFEV